MPRPPALYLLVVLALASRVASAQPVASEDDAARRRSAYQRADSALKAKKWAEAERLFKPLWNERQTYDVALGLGQAEFIQKEYRGAAEHLAFAIRNIPPHDKPETLDRPRLALTEAKKHVAAVHLTVARTGAEILVDGAHAGTAPLEDDLFLAPGKHTIEARIADREPAEQSVEAIAGAQLSIALEFSEPAPGAGPGAGLGSEQDSAAAAPPRRAAAPAPLSADELRTSPNRSSQTEGWVVGTGAALTVIAVAVATGYALNAHSKQSEVDRLKSQTQAELGQNCAASDAGSVCSALDAAATDRNSANRTARAAFITSGVLAVGTAAAFLLWPASERPHHVRISPSFDRTSAELTLQGAF